MNFTVPPVLVVLVGDFLQVVIVQLFSLVISCYSVFLYFLYTCVLHVIPAVSLFSTKAI